MRLSRVPGSTQHGGGWLQVTVSRYTTGSCTQFLVLGSLYAMVVLYYYYLQDVHGGVETALPRVSIDAFHTRTNKRRRCHSSIHPRLRVIQHSRHVLRKQTKTTEAQCR